MIWHSQNGIHMAFKILFGLHALTFEDFPRAGQRSGRGLSTSLTRWPAMGSTRSLWFGSMTGEPPMKARAEKTAAPPDWCCYVRLCGYALCWFQRTCGAELYRLFIKPFFASHMLIADCNDSMLFHDMPFLCRQITAGDFVNFGQKCVLADLDVATWNWFCAGGLHWVVRLLWQPFPSPPKWEAGKH